MKSNAKLSVVSTANWARAMSLREMLQAVYASHPRFPNLNLPGGVVGGLGQGAVAWSGFGKLGNGHWHFGVHA
jgi:hypothetical protein